MWQQCYTMLMEQIFWRWMGSKRACVVVPFLPMSSRWKWRVFLVLIIKQNIYFNQMLVLKAITSCSLPIISRTTLGSYENSDFWCYYFLMAYTGRNIDKAFFVFSCEKLVRLEQIYKSSFKDDLGNVETKDILNHSLMSFWLCQMSTTRLKNFVERGQW